MPKNSSRDHWHVFANRLFFDYVRTRLGKDPRAWGDFPEYLSPRWETPQAHSTRIACAHKARFVDLMAELEELPSAADIRDRWGAAMREAEAEIASYLATLPTAGTLALT